VQPFRFGPNQAVTCDQDHTYTHEQKAANSGLMDKVVESVGRGAGSCPDNGKGKGAGHGLLRRQHRHRLGTTPSTSP